MTNVKGYMTNMTGSNLHCAPLRLRGDVEWYDQELMEVPYGIA
jgi:hypothetical protein